MGSGEAFIEKAWVFRCGLTVHAMKENSEIIRRMDAAVFVMQMAISMMASGAMTRLTDMVFIFIPMVRATKATGRMIYSMVMVWKVGKFLHSS